MSALDELFDVRRILVAFDPMMPETALLEAAVEFARLVEAEVEGLFVEDIELTRLAELPFVHELSLPAGTLKPLDIAAIERDWRALAANMRQALEAHARKSGVPVSFRVVRGRMDVEVGAAAESVDLVILSRAGSAVTRHVRLQPRTGPAARESPRPVLLLPGLIAEIDRIFVLYDDAEASKSALGVAARLESRLRAAGNVLQVTALCLGETKAAAERAAAGAREISKAAGIAVEFRLIVGRAELSAALRGEENLLLVLPASLAWPAGDELETLAADWQGSILLVR